MILNGNIAFGEGGVKMPPPMSKALRAILKCASSKYMPSKPGFKEQEGGKSTAGQGGRSFKEEEFSEKELADIQNIFYQYQEKQTPEKPAAVFPERQRKQKHIAADLKRWEGPNEY